MPRPLQIVHDVDPKEQILAECQEMLADFRLRPTDVMLVMYQRDKTGDVIQLAATGLYLPNSAKSTVAEDAYQGKIGLVIKVGSLAFTTDDDHRWGDFVPKLGDWVVINVGDTFSFDLPNGRRARCVDENLVRLIVPRPDSVW